MVDLDFWSALPFGHHRFQKCTPKWSPLYIDNAFSKPSKMEFVLVRISYPECLIGVFVTGISELALIIKSSLCSS